MFICPGVVHFPATPMLTINDCWVGKGSDRNKLLLNIERGIWSRAFVVVGINDWCYTIRGSLGTFEPVPITDMGLFDGTTKFDSAWWHDSGVIHCTPDRGWVLDDVSYGEGNYYTISFGSGGEVYANPVGPWTDEDNPPESVTMEVDWPRLQTSRSYGSVTWFGRYVPATTHVHDSVSGEITIGMPSWKATIDDEEVVMAKTDAQFDYPPEEQSDKDEYEYVTKDGFGFKWNTEHSRYEMKYKNDKLYWANPPTVEQSWTWNTTDANDNPVTVGARWNAWIAGFSDKAYGMFEIARLM